MFAFASPFTPSFRAARGVATCKSRPAVARMSLDDSISALAADACELTGVCDASAPIGKADLKIARPPAEARVLRIDGARIQDYQGKESVLRDDSIMD